MRIYLNSMDSNLPWSTDYGPNTAEENWREVSILSPAYTRTDMGKRGSLQEPCCWIETSGVILHGPWEEHGIAVIQ